MPVTDQGAKLAAPSVARRLSNREYNNVIASLIYDASRPFTAGEGKRTPFDNESDAKLNSAQIASPVLIDQLSQMAEDAASRLLGDKARLGRVMASVGCAPKTDDDLDRACFRQLLTKLGRRALRRPLTEANLDAYMQLFAAAEEDKNFYTAVGLAVRLFLQSPELLYRIEADDTRPVPGQPGVFQISGYEMASRLSFLIWGDGPDDILLDQAKENQLGDPRAIRQAVARMFADPRARETLAAFHALWLNYESMGGVDGNLMGPLRDQTSALIGKMLFPEAGAAQGEQRPWQDLFRSDVTRVTYELAKHYGLAIPAGSMLKASTGRTEWLRWDADRMGLLSEGSFLALAGTNREEQMVIRRGSRIRELLLCGDPIVKPAAVESMDKPISPCKWDVMAAHRSSGSCAACHNLMDPVGFGLDAYDRQGAKRTHDKVDQFIRMKFPERTDLKDGDVLLDCPVHAEGALDPTDPATKFSGPRQLAELLLQSPRLGSCVTQQLYRFASGRSVLDDNDKVVVAAVRAGVGTGDFKLTDLVAALVSTDAFRSRRQAN